MLDPLTNVRSNGNGYQECQILHFSSYFAQIVILEPQTPKKHPTSGFLYLKNYITATVKLYFQNLLLEALTQKLEVMAQWVPRVQKFTLISPFLDKKNFAQIVILEPQTSKNTLRLDSYIKKNLHNCYSKTLFLELTLAFLTLFD